MLWTDAGSREFISEHYPWFLDTFDGYTYPIQRADVIRYFILYHYGGVYIDLDIGCLRPMAPLLAYPVILPITNPVGISNDLMFAEPGHPFMAQTIHNLVTFDHNWILNYPTVMFSTGPMFLSAQYGLFTTSHPATPQNPGGEVRVLPRSLYGKNAKPGEAPHSFFSHYYGSSWHADDAAFIGFLGKWGKILMWIGLAILVVGIVRMALSPHGKQRKYSLRRIGGYEVMMPRWRTRDGRWHLDLGWFSLPASGVSSQPSSPVSLSDEEDEVQLLPISLDSRSFSPSPSEVSFGDTIHSSGSFTRPITNSLRRAGTRVWSYFARESNPTDPLYRSHRPRRSRGVLFFLPAFFTPSHGVETFPQRSRSRHTYEDAAPEYPPDKPHMDDNDFETTSLVPVPDLSLHSRAGSSSCSESSSTVC